jgi:SAM-dependent methyltransferase
MTGRARATPRAQEAQGAKVAGDATVARYHAHRAAFSRNPALRQLYQSWYGRVAGQLPARASGPVIELGSGPGLAREFMEDMLLSDVVRASWLDLMAAAEALPIGDETARALVMFDVLHHLPSPGRFFAEAVRVLRPGGRLVVCEPYVSAASYLVYRFLHEEGLDFRVQPFEQELDPGKDPFAGNQAVPTMLLVHGRAELQRRFPRLRVIHVETFAGPSYPASGGFSRPPLLPGRLWQALFATEARLPRFVWKWLGFRLLAVIEKAS